jgi:hypothetical protein
MRCGDSPGDCATASIGSYAHRLKDIVVEVGERPQHGFGKRLNRFAAPSWRLDHRWVIPLDIFGEQGYEVR